MYGLTETKRTLYLPPDQLDVRPGSVGIAIPGTEVWLEDEPGNRLGPGEMGELVVRGRHVMRGYWGDPAATRPALPSRAAARRARSAIPATCSARMTTGILYFVARKDDIIKSRGEKVAPKEVENVSMRLEGVAEAAVIGVPDPVLGEAIKAFVVVSGARSDRGRSAGALPGEPGRLHGSAAGRVPDGAAQDRIGQDQEDGAHMSAVDIAAATDVRQDASCVASVGVLNLAGLEPPTRRPAADAGDDPASWAGRFRHLPG